MGGIAIKERNAILRDALQEVKRLNDWVLDSDANPNKALLRQLNRIATTALEEAK